MVFVRIAVAVLALRAGALPDAAHTGAFLRAGFVVVCGLRARQQEPQPGQDVCQRHEAAGVEWGEGMTMGAARKIEGRRAPTESGEFDRHALERAAGILPTEVPEPAPVPTDSGVRLRSVRRAALRAEMGPALDVAMSLAGVSDPDVAACVDEAPQRIGQMRAKTLPMTAEHLACLGRSRDERMRAVYAHVEREMRGGR